MSQNELSHHGILGQKWGVRRYQNKDGSLTPAGKKRAKQLKDEYTQLTAKQLRRSTSGIAKKPSEMTDEELASKLSRLTNEKRYMELVRDIDKMTPKPRDNKIATLAKSYGSDVLSPAIKSASRDALTKWLTKTLQEAAGVGEDTSKKSLEQLEKDVKKLAAKKKKWELEQYVKEFEAAAKEGRPVDFSKIQTIEKSKDKKKDD